MLTDAIVQLVGWAFGSIQGLGLTLTLVFLGFHTRKLARVGGFVTTLSWYLILLGVLVLTGVVTIHPGEAAGLVGRVLDLAMGVLG